MPHNLSSLSPSQFETLAADLLSAMHGVYFQRYTDGRDGGIDCLHETESGEVWIGQSKRYKSTSNLLSKIPEEQQKMAKLSNPPARYFLVTSCGLTQPNKEAIKAAMQPFILSTADILGKDDINGLLQEYSDVYRKNHALWLHGIEQLNVYLQYAHNIRMGAELQRIHEESTYYISTPFENVIHQQLESDNACLITGEPGMGKSTIAGQVALQWLLNNPTAELAWINDRNFDQALQLIRTNEKQILVLDDFLGATFLDTQGLLAFAKDWQALLLHAQRNQGQLKLIFTTRDYILEQALSLLDEGYSQINRLCKKTITIENNSAKFRVDLLTNLIKNSNLDYQQLEILVNPKNYWPLLKAKTFTPRLYTTLIERLEDLPPEEVEQAIQQSARGQNQLWQSIFNRLSQPAQTLMYLMAVAGQYADALLLKAAYNTLYQQIFGTIAPLNSFDQALIELEPVFITTETHLNKIWCNPRNPSVIDFLHQSIKENTPLINALISSLQSLNWGLQYFAISKNSNNPIALKAAQHEPFLIKLVELLSEESSQVMQTYDGEKIVWEEQVTSFGLKLGQVWQLVLNDPALARRLFIKLEELLPQSKEWRGLFKQGGMKELLDLSCYMPVDQQPQIWKIATENIGNSEDAAAIASFYQRNKAARQYLKPQRKKLIENLLDACEDEIFRTNDPDYLGMILNDLYVLEEALGADISYEKHFIYRKIEGIHSGEFDESLFDYEPAYYNRPEPSNNHNQVLVQLAAMTEEIERRLAVPIR